MLICNVLVGGAMTENLVARHYDSKFGWAVLWEKTWMYGIMR